MQPEVLIEEKSGLEYLEIDNGAENTIIMFHGYGASMMDLFDLGKVIQTKDKYNWVFPNGHLNLYQGMMARAWFPIDERALQEAMMSGKSRSFEDVDTDEFQLAIKKCEDFITGYKKTNGKLIVGGFSQGSMISTHASLSLSESIDALLCLSGTFISSKRLITALETSKKFPFFQSHGKDDQILGYGNAKQLFELMKLGGHEGDFVSFNGGHEIPMDVITKAGKFIDRV